ncbi:MAG TPA: DUF6580 family putative transport protein [Terriglobia bacterium]|nr:DUF6580 family putative transport protein [Terriglobia bacterium]
MAYLFVIAAVIFRIVPHPWNVTPLAAMFLFSGATFRNRVQSLAVPFAALLVSDFAVDRFLYHGAYAWFSPYTWSGFLLIGLIGWVLHSKITLRRVATASIVGSVSFFFLTNFGVWAAGGLYPHNFAGLTDCYVAGLPFFRNTILGDLAWSGILFGTYEWVNHRRTLAPAETH